MPKIRAEAAGTWLSDLVTPLAQTLIPFLDSAMPPTAAQATTGFRSGHRGWGFYPIGVDGDEDPYNTWTPTQVEVTRQAGFIPFPIWVPSPSLDSDPVDAANEAHATSLSAGCSASISVLYSGNHIEKGGQVTGPIWLPIPGSPPGSIGAQSAIQWGQTTVGGLSVDVNLAAQDFPFATAIVVDFEYNTAAGAKGVAWYKAFQQRIKDIAKPTPPPVPKPPVPIPGGHHMRKALPAAALPATTRTAGWSPNNVQYDVIMDGKDGHVYHIWYHGGGWNGPEDLTAAG